MSFLLVYYKSHSQIIVAILPIPHYLSPYLPHFFFAPRTVYQTTRNEVHVSLFRSIITARSQDLNTCDFSKSYTALPQSPSYALIFQASSVAVDAIPYFRSDPKSLCHLILTYFPDSSNYISQFFFPRTIPPAPYSQGLSHLSLQPAWLLAVAQVSFPSSQF